MDYSEEEQVQQGLASRPGPVVPWWSYLCIVVWGLLGLIVLPGAGMAGMAFDAPGSEYVLWTILVGYGLLFFPLIALGSAIGLIILRAIVRCVGYRIGLARFFALAPLVDILAVVIGSVGSVWFCGGRLNCA